MAEISAVVLDIGNVVIEWVPERYFDQAIGVERRLEFFEQVPIIDANAAIDCGADFTGTLQQLALDHPQWETEIRLWQDNWLAIVGPAIPRSVRLLRALRAKGIPVLALSNFGVQPFEQAQNHYGFLTEFDERYISGHLQMIKPDPEIYAALEEGSGYAPKGLLFADDLPQNIAAAAARGWQTHLFKDADGWADCLVSRGLLSAAEAQ